MKNEKKHIARKATKADIAAAAAKAKELLGMPKPRYKVGDFIFIKNSKTVGKVLYKYARKNVYECRYKDGSSSDIDVKYITRRATKEEIEKFKSFEAPNKKPLNAKVIPDRALYKGKGCQVLCVSGHDYCVIMDDVDGKFWVDEKELNYGTSQPRYKKGDHVRVRDMPKFKAGDSVRMLSEAELREKQLDFLPEELTGHQILMFANRTFTVEKTDKDSVLLSNGLWVGDWMIAGLAGQEKIEVGDRVKLVRGITHESLADLYGTITSEYEGTYDVLLDQGRVWRVTAAAVTLVSKAAPESAKPVQSLTARIETLEKELAELKRKVG